MSKNKITSIIAHIDHGKTTLIDSIIASTGFFSKSLAGDLRYLDSRKDEQERGITLKLSPIKLPNGHVFIDTPGHVDFESLIFSSSALGDNHLILIDVNEGITPRTYSLVKFLNRNRCILVLNKVDKCLDFDQINLIIDQVNGLLKDNVFEWTNNNIILCSASLGAGLSYRTFKQSKKNTISMAFKGFKMLDDKIEGKDVAQIVKKYNIKFPNRKSIFSAVFPLVDTIFDTVDFIYENSNLIKELSSMHLSADDIPKIHSSSEDITKMHSSVDDDLITSNDDIPKMHSSVDNDLITSNDDIPKMHSSVDKDLITSADNIHKMHSSVDNINNLTDKIDKSVNAFENDTPADVVCDKKVILDNTFFSIHARKLPDFLAVTTYGLLKTKNDYTKENILFLAKIHNGTIKKGQKLFCCNSETTKEVTVDEIYDFEIEKYLPVDSFDQKSLILLKGDFLKNSAISSEPIDFKIKNFPTGFYTAKLALRNLSQIAEIKSMIKVLGVIEQNLKCKLNKFSEFEFKCNGSVQFEKVCFDLKEAGFDFAVKPSKKEFKEQSGVLTTSKYEDGGIKLHLSVGPINKFDDFIKSINLEIYENNVIKNDKKNNIYYIEDESNHHIIESVLSVFTDFGPLIKENITNSFFVVQSIVQNDTRFFNILKNELSSIYMNSNPTVYPLFINMKIYVSKYFSGIIYLCLQKFFYIVDNEEYDDDTNFTILECKVPQFVFNELVDEIRTKSKGSAYLKVLGSEYIAINDFSYMISQLRKEKGLYIEEVIGGDDLEKQRSKRN